MLGLWLHPLTLVERSTPPYRCVCPCRPRCQPRGPGHALCSPGELRRRRIGGRPVAAQSAGADVGSGGSGDPGLALRHADRVRGAPQGLLPLHVSVRAPVRRFRGYGAAVRAQRGTFSELPRSPRRRLRRGREADGCGHPLNGWAMRTPVRATPPALPATLPQTPGNCGTHRSDRARSTPRPEPCAEPWYVWP